MHEKVPHLTRRDLTDIVLPKVRNQPIPFPIKDLVSIGVTTRIAALGFVKRIEFLRICLETAIFLHRLIWISFTTIRICKLFRRFDSL